MTPEQIRRETRRKAKAERLRRANRLIETIATCGRRFFNHRDAGKTISRFELDPRGRVWFRDGWSEKRIYTHYNGAWRHFSQGGTLRDLVVALRDYIGHGTRLRPSRFGPWPDWICGGDLWGYGDSIQRVRDEAARLQIV